VAAPADTVRAGTLRVGTIPVGRAHAIRPAVPGPTIPGGDPASALPPRGGRTRRRSRQSRQSAHPIPPGTALKPPPHRGASAPVVAPGAAAAAHRQWYRLRLPLPLRSNRTALHHLIGDSRMITFGEPAPTPNAVASNVGRDPRAGGPPRVRVSTWVTGRPDHPLRARRKRSGNGW
jgi:hypothetical protein